MKSRVQLKILTFVTSLLFIASGMFFISGKASSQEVLDVNHVVGTEVEGISDAGNKHSPPDDKMLEEAGVVDEQQKEEDTSEGMKNSSKEKYGFSIDAMPSLFFTYWQQQSIIDAKNSRGRNVRPPTEAELAALENGDDIKPKPEERYVSLGGIVYNDGDDWTIWLNGKRVHPDAIPEEVLSLKVYKEYIEIKWLDTFTNQVFPLRLRAHQRFNMDMRIFLPG